MGLTHSASIVTDGLVLCLDAANKRSYPGSGTIIYDLSGKGNHGTLYNGVGFSTKNSGILTFDGTNDYVGTVGPDLSYTNFTVMGAARYSGSPGSRGRMISAWYSSTNSNWLLGHWSDSVESYYAEGWVSSAGAGGSDNNWRTYTGTGNISADSYAFYVNGILKISPNNNGGGGPNKFAIGSYGDGEYSTGEFSFLLAYNRVLLSSEIQQNYNATRGRFV